MVFKVYLAGPECFSIHADKLYADLVELCKSHGFQPIIPLLNTKIPDLEPYDKARWIANQCRQILSECDLVLANVSPYRSVSADVGTCVEIGIAVALDKPIYAWSDDLRPIAEKLHANGLVTHRTSMGLVDDSEQWIEEFDMPDNCMIHGLVSKTLSSPQEAIMAMKKTFNS